MKLKELNQIDNATKDGRIELFRIGTAILFIVGIMLYIEMNLDIGEGKVMLAAAAMIGGYMAINIGANDVANNVGPAVGSQALTLVGAICIAAIFEASGALIAGGDVVGTIKNGIIDPALISDKNNFVWLMMAALLAAAVWLNIATALGAPVSTTHSIVGGVLGAGIAVGGTGIADWSKVGMIAASWVISPLLGGIIAALFLYVIKRMIVFKDDKLAAAQKVVPFLLMIMAWSFTTYLMLKGLNKIWSVSFVTASAFGLVVAFIVLMVTRPLIRRASIGEPNDAESVNKLFTIPLIISAAFLSFAHGANDVANAVGPLAAINAVLVNGEAVITEAKIPLWVMLVGAIGISLGLALWGPKLIRTVGSEITELNRSRAFCIAMAAAITVIVASQLGLPVSSTHIAVGGIFGVGFLREYLVMSQGEKLEEIKHHHDNDDPEAVDQFIEEFKHANIERQDELLTQLKNKSTKALLTKKERKTLGKIHQQKLVKRSHILKIASAWIVTVPVSGVLAALFYYSIKGMMLSQ